MNKKKREELIEQWATSIIPCVFCAETRLNEKHPEWMGRLRNIPKDKIREVQDEYCMAIAEEIVSMTE